LHIVALYLLYCILILPTKQTVLQLLYLKYNVLVHNKTKTPCEASVLLIECNNSVRVIVIICSRFQSCASVFYDPPTTPAISSSFFAIVVTSMDFLTVLHNLSLSCTCSSCSFRKADCNVSAKHLAINKRTILRSDRNDGTASLSTADGTAEIVAELP
jgi:hypothetical protein